MMYSAKRSLHGRTVQFEISYHEGFGGWVIQQFNILEGTGWYLTCYSGIEDSQNTYNQACVLLFATEANAIEYKDRFLKDPIDNCSRCMGKKHGN